MHAAAVTTPPAKKASKFSVQKAATPQGAKRSAVETVTKGQAPAVPKASKATCAPPTLDVRARLFHLSSDGVLCLEGGIHR